MVQEKIVEIKKEEVVETPKDTVQDGEIKSLTKMTWKEYLTNKIKNADKLKAALTKFENPEQKMIVMVFQTETGLIDEDTASYYSPIKERSKMGKILSKYGDLRVGTKIKVVFDGEGYPEIKIK